MSEIQISRRSSYGPSSPEVGNKGAVTRQRIVDASLKLFGTVGYFNTSVDAIAQVADVSRATLYQYFPGKDAIFRELLEACGKALLRVVRRLGPLGANDVGFDNLNWWLGEWGWVYEKYATMFVQWNAVAATQSDIRTDIADFHKGYTHRIAERLRSFDLADLDSDAAAVAISALVNRMNFYIHTGRSHGRSVESIADGISVHLQLFLFPDTPRTAFEKVRLATSGPSIADVPGRPSTTGLSVDERTYGLTTRAAKTVRALVAAGADQFNSQGYHPTNVDDIVQSAGYARGTFYKYFRDKQDLLATLAVETTNSGEALMAQLPTVDFTDKPALQSWVTSFIDNTDRYSGLMVAWTEGVSDCAVAAALGAHMQASLDRALVEVISAQSLYYPSDPVVSALTLRAALSHVPTALAESRVLRDRNAKISFVTSMIRRGFLGLSD
ncbi:TetR/AcrR family transcriptional regulator [Rhodococcus wratislaviensis]|uniref:TetR/AcrR family transcriptional regulator n=1 Tax=Rhodococcus wratislaviensis TaxID=44752 RepID=UPI003649FEBD